MHRGKRARGSEGGNVMETEVFWASAAWNASLRQRERLCRQRAFWSAIEWMPRELVSVAVLNSADAWRRSRRTTQRTNLLLSCSRPMKQRDRRRFPIRLGARPFPSSCRYSANNFIPNPLHSKGSAVSHRQIRKFDVECRIGCRKGLGNRFTLESLLFSWGSMFLTLKSADRTQLRMY